MKKVILVCLILVAAMVAALSTASNAEGTGKPEFVTICHAAGQEGTTQFVTLTLPYNAVYGQAGHFNEPGTPAAGHEQDYEGACVEEPVECPDGDFNGEEPGCGEPPVECPNGDFNGEEPGCGEPPVECPGGDFNGELPGCGEPPVECPGGDFNGEAPGCGEPPVECPNGDLNGPEPGCETVVVPPRCPPGEGPYDGKDGEPGNEECCPDANNDQKCDEATPPVTPPVMEPPVVTPEPPVVVPPVTTPPVTKPKPEKPKTVKPPKVSTDGPVSKPKPVAPVPTANEPEGTLPYTGFSLWMAFALAGLLIGSGLLLRKLSH